MIRLLSGDCRDVLPTLPAESVQCVVCSPPYYALRSYLDATHPDKHREIGSEPTPDEYLATMVEVFREVRRVLRRDGVCFVNMGDSYAGSQRVAAYDRDGKEPASCECYSLGGAHQGYTTPSHKPEARSGEYVGEGGKAPLNVRNRNGLGYVAGYKPKDLLLMPARLALALQADGWWVRSDIIWHKPNPMPESVTDRPTSAHEHVYLLTRSARYFYDADAVREVFSESTVRIHSSAGVQWRAGSEWKSDLVGNGHSGLGNGPATLSAGFRNLRNVWTIATEPFRESHFATMPTAVVEKCVLAGTSERGCCAACGKPWVRVTERVAGASGEAIERPKQTAGMWDGTSTLSMSGHHGAGWRERGPTATTTGWSPGCQCDAETVPCTILDPFAGAGTSLLVADRLQRDAIGIELNTAYTEMAMERCRADAPLFTSFPPAEPPEDERMADLFTDMAAD